MERRKFLAACGAGCAASALPTHALEAIQPRHYARVLLVSSGGRPLRIGEIERKRNYIFQYPYASTPCFLLNVGRRAEAVGALRTADARTYRWPGGVGPQRAVVAYSAICAHQLAYPTRDISFISFRDEATPHSRLKEVIHCCSEHSQYDPASGGKVLAGPAPQPLAAILLEHDAARDELHAVGTLGGEMFNEFFSRFAFRLALEHGGERATRPVEGSTQVVELDRYCRQQVRC